MKLSKLLVALIAPLLVVSACGDDGDNTLVAGDNASATAALLAAPDKAAEAGSGRMEMTFTISDGDQTFEMTATGAFSGTRAMMEMDLGSLFSSLGGDEDMPPGMDEPIRYVMDGTTTYIRFPMLQALAGGGEWFSVSPTDLGMAEDALGLGLGSGASGNPAQFLDTLRGISDDIEAVGDEKVRDVATTHYRVVVDMAKAAEQVPEEARAAYEQALGELGMSELPMDVWIGADGLVRRMAFDLADLAAGMDDSAGLGDIGSGQMVMDIFDYGADVDIEIPDPSTVTPFTEVMGGLGGFGSEAMAGS